MRGEQKMAYDVTETTTTAMEVEEVWNPRWRARERG